MKFWSIFCLFIISIELPADEPPNFHGYRVFSENKHFAAVIDSKKNSPGEFSLSVYLVFKNELDTIPYWSSDFKHSGYPLGLLSNDGKTFAVVKQWYSKCETIVDIYSENQVQKLTSKDLTIYEEDFKSTVSHHLWLNKSSDFIYAENNISPVKLQINTLSGKRFINIQ